MSSGYERPVKTHGDCPFPECGGHGCYTEWADGGGYCHQCGGKKGPKREETWRNNLEDKQVVESKIISYRNLPEAVVKKYKIKTGFDDKGNEVRREYSYPNSQTKYRYLPKDFSKNFGFRAVSLFGMDLFNAGSSKSITIVEGEDDAPAAFYMLGGQHPVVSLPSATISDELLKNCHEYLDSFKEIIVATDNDKAGEKAATRISLTFPNKTYRVSLSKHKDAQEYLASGDKGEFKFAWLNKKKYVPENILNTPDQFLDLYKNTPEHLYVPTGIQELDNIILGLMQGMFTVIKAKTGQGKSLAPHTPVLKFNGDVVRADEVEEGDQLMGPDGLPRNVTNVNLQQGPMYRITPVKGEPFECNADHILSLRHTSTGEIKNVLLTDYLKWSKGTKHLWKLWRTGVEFEGSRVNDEAMAYCLGAYLGDGRAAFPEFSLGLKKQPVIDYLYNTHLQPTRSKFDRGCFVIGFSKSSALWKEAEKALEGGRHIPKEYKVSSGVIRRNILAGLLDADGSLNDGGAEITQKSEALADDICFVARSLGLAAYKKTKIVNGASYYRVHISGDMTSIPCKRLKFKPRRQIKNVLNTGFKVECIGEGTYRGIALDGDHLFMLGDFTVTHNTELMRYLEYKLIKEGVPIASWHLEETKVRSLLGLVSYELGDNVTRKDLIESKGKADDVDKAIYDLTKDENFYQFFLRDGDGTQELIDQIRYFVTVCGVKYVFFEPIQDVLGNSEELLADLSIRLSKLAAELNVGIITIAHTNDDNEIKYCRMIGQRAAVILSLARDTEATDDDVRNTTFIKVEKNRPCSTVGYGGCMKFDPKSFTMEENYG